MRLRTSISFVFLVALLSGCPGPHVGTEPTPPERPRIEGRRLRVPPRRPDAPTGTRFARLAARMNAVEREAAIVEEVLAGNVPAFQRTLVPVELEAMTRSGKKLHGRVFVLPDYLALGDDTDFVRIPLTIRSARRLARELGCVLPTTRLVDVIHERAEVRVTSPRMGPGKRMGTMEYFVAHNQRIEERRRAAGGPLGALLSGPKKDLVITGRMLETPGRTPIYGWFASDGQPVQPLSLVHDDRYVDYAHGVRFVDGEMEVKGTPRAVLDVLASRELAALISAEGAYDIRTPWARGW